MAYRRQYTVTKRQTRFFVLSMLSAVFLSLIAFVSYFTNVSSVLGSAVSIILSPVTESCAFVVDGIVGIKQYFGDIAFLKEENIRLQTENENLKKEQARYEAIAKENDQLYAYLGLKKDFTDLSLVNAKIILKGSGSFMTSFTIDKGTLHGVRHDMPVITDKGILGIVSEEGLTSSRCISIVSHNASAGIYLLRTGVTGLLEGDYSLSQEGLCKISGLGVDTDIRVGDFVYTSGFGEIYPRDLCVGTVTEIIRDAATHTLTATVKPSCEPDRLDTVMVITDFERRYEEIPQEE